MQKQLASNHLKGILDGSIDTEGIEALRTLAATVGQFIDYWGFRSVHGQIWCVLWLAKRPFCVIEISKILDLSKALISPALVQLEEYGLIEQVDSVDSRKKFYRSVSEVMPCIHRILRQREQVLLNEASVKAMDLKSSSLTIIDQARLERLQAMVDSAKYGLDLMLMLNFLDPSAATKLSSTSPKG